MNSSVVATAAAVAAADDGDSSARCDLLGGFALFVQGALGALALLVLIWKRSREHPQRPLLVWFMDVSKQVIGAVLVHIANLLLSLLSSGSFIEPNPSSIAAAENVPSFRTLVVRDGVDDGDDQYHSNPCSFYLLNLGIDTTLGVVILIYLLRFFHKIVVICPIPGLRTGITSGYYGEPPKWRYWTKQALIYFLGLMTMKFMVWMIFAIFPWLGRVGDWLLAWTEGNRQLQIFFVMFFFPLVMNAFQYYVIDSFIKHQDPAQTVIEDVTPVDSEPDHHTRHSFNYTEDDEDNDSASESGSGSRGLLQPVRRGRKPFPGQNVEEYNPDYDGTNNSVRSDHAPGSPQSGYFKSTNRRGSGTGKKTGTVGSQKSRNSSMMLLPGSRGPSTPGYADEEQGSSNASGRGSSRVIFGDDESTLVEGDRERER
ncbi:vacuolar membrane protein-domain-containing protein [Geopyxis carbonaria]|nr:vacuolar membrane protein-domain-containing protein [Geopyxis carbonaria]